MYNLESYNFGELLRRARKSKKISVKEIANKLNKTETTIYKYERNVLMPDLLTVMEICNVLDVGFNDLANIDRVEEARENSNNPFPVNSIYLYYIGFSNNLLCFELEIKSEGGLQKVYFKNIENDSILYVGTIESSQDIAYLYMKNFYINNKKYEKVEIVLNLKYASDERYMGMINGTYDVTNEPLVKKCIVLMKQINHNSEEEVKALKKRLTITEKEFDVMREKQGWIMATENTNDYKII